MFTEIENELKVLETRCFTGTAKFGIERGEIHAYYLTSKVDTSTIINSQKDIKPDLIRLYPDENEFYGSIEYYFKFGKIVASNYSVSFQGQQLVDYMKRAKTCRVVKIAVKKSNT